MGKKSKEGLGRALIKDRFGATRGKKKVDNNSMLHTTEINDGYEWGRLNLQSVTAESSLQEFLSTAELAGKEFTAEKLNLSVAYTAPVVVDRTITKQQHGQPLTIPRRPVWVPGVLASEQDIKEKDAFLEWKRNLMSIQEKEKTALTPYERNIELWRQLWRTLEKSDLLLILLDARNPLLFRCEDLEKAAAENNAQCVLLLNKADLINEEERKLWASYFEEKGIRIAFFSAAATPNTEKQKSEYKVKEKNFDFDDGNDESVNESEDSEHESSAKPYIESNNQTDLSEVNKKNNVSSSSVVDTLEEYNNQENKVNVNSISPHSNKEKNIDANTIHLTSCIDQNNALNYEVEKEKKNEREDKTLISDALKIAVFDNGKASASGLGFAFKNDKDSHNSVADKNENTVSISADIDKNVNLLSMNNEVACKNVTKNSCKVTFVDAKKEDNQRSAENNTETEQVNAEKVPPDRIAKTDYKIQESCSMQAGINDNVKSPCLNDEITSLSVNVTRSCRVTFEGDKNENTQQNMEGIKDTKQSNTEEALLNKIQTKNNVINSPYILDRSQLIAMLKAIHINELKNPLRLTVGLIGYPNVGKSSTINSIIQTKKVSVSAMPGHTRHVQSLVLDDLLLLDCPGLVLPAYAVTPDLLLTAVLPIDQMTSYEAAIQRLIELVGREEFRTRYGLLLPDSSGPFLPQQLLSAHAFNRGFMTAAGRPDEARSARLLLKQAASGRLRWAQLPPGMSKTVPESKLDSKQTRKPTPLETRLVQGWTTAAEDIDRKFFSSHKGTAHIKGILTPGISGVSVPTGDTSSEKPWKLHNKHANKNKKEKLRKTYWQLDKH